jgi:signal transduction histidine kinase
LRKRQKAVAKLWQEAHTTTDMSSLLDNVGKVLDEVLDVMCSYVLEYQSGNSELLLRSASSNLGNGPSMATYPLSSTSLEGYALLTNEAILTGDLHADERFSGTVRAYVPTFASALCAIIVSSRRPFGVIVAGRSEQHAFQPADLDFLQEMAYILAFALVRNEADSAQAAVKALRQDNESRRALLAMVSHDLRTPLHHIKGYASALLKRRHEFEAEAIDEYLEIICDESDRLDLLVQDLLSMALIETGRLQLEIESVQLDDLLRETIGHWQHNDSHQFSLRLPDQVPPIPADSRRVQQVLENLVVNVVHHTPPGTLATVTLEVMRSEVIVSISDNGPGIAIEHVPNIFQIFYQAAPSGYRSTGLGLFICKGIIELHGGRIWVETAPELGTTFRFSLPRRLPIYKQPEAPSKPNDVRTALCG